MNNPIRFINHDKSTFSSTLRKRVNQYFTDNNISRFGNRKMVIKSIILIGVYILSYLAIYMIPVNIWFLLGLTLLMGISKAGIGMSVMHDALHGAYSKNALTNKLLGNTIYMLGANAVVWKLHHNVFHHTYTNIHGLDEDIENKAIIRLSNQAPLKWIHRYQHIYAFFLYSFMTLLLFVSDFIKLANYYKLDVVKEGKSQPKKAFIKLAGFKLIYLFFMLVLPVLVTPFLWWHILIGFLVMHLTAGYILSIIFQMAHIVEGAEQPNLNQDGNVENAWAIHQLQTTANFSKNSQILSWYIGGLNFQIEHHLFPNICHVHYPKISGIVKQTAEDYGLDYNVNPTLIHAVLSHVRQLKMLGRKPA